MTISPFICTPLTALICNQSTSLFLVEICMLTCSVPLCHLCSPSCFDIERVHEHTNLLTGLRQAQRCRGCKNLYNCRLKIRMTTSSCSHTIAASFSSYRPIALFRSNSWTISPIYIIQPFDYICDTRVPTCS